MFIVIDANELFSLLIKGNKSSKEIFLSKSIELVAPEFILEEFSNNKDELLSKTHKTEAEFSEALSVLKDRIKFIPKEKFEEFIPKACELIPEHIKDAEYFALALKYNCSLWSEERLLKKQSCISVLNTNELSKLLLFEVYKQMEDTHLKPVDMISH